MKNNLFLLISFFSLLTHSYENPCFESRDWENTKCEFRNTKEKKFKISGKQGDILTFNRLYELKDLYDKETLRFENLIKENNKKIEEYVKKDKKVLLEKINVAEKNINIFRKNIEAFNKNIETIEKSKLVNKSILEQLRIKGQRIVYSKEIEQQEILIDQFLKKESDKINFNYLTLVSESTKISMIDFYTKKMNSNEKEKSEEEEKLKNLKDGSKIRANHYQSNIDQLKEINLTYEGYLKDYKEKSRKNNLKISKAKENNDEYNYILENLKGDISNFLSTKTLNDCQRSCLIKCSVANYLTWKDLDLNKYKNNGIINHRSLGLTLKERIGNCNDFSELYKVLSEIGEIESKRSFSKIHAFNQVKINNKWYRLEPQSDKCIFIKN